MAVSFLPAYRTATDLDLIGDSVRCGQTGTQQNGRMGVSLQLQVKMPRRRRHAEVEKVCSETCFSLEHSRNSFLCLLPHWPPASTAAILAGNDLTLFTRQRRGGVEVGAEQAFFQQNHDNVVGKA